jgi:Tol biopolymer transport system component
MPSKGLRSAAAAPLLATLVVGFHGSGARGAEAAFPGENGLIVFESDRTEKAGEHIYAIRLSEGGRMKGVADVGRGYSAVPSPDGTRVAFFRRELTSGACFGLYVKPLESPTEQLIERSCRIGPVSAAWWSPNGRRLAYVRDGPELVIARLGTGNVHAIPGASAPEWLRDGSIVFEKGGSLYRVREGSSPVRLRLGRCIPDWAPDGKSVACLDSDQEWPGARMFVARSDGSGRRLLARGSISMPAWSPSGRQIAFLRRREPSGAPMLYVINRDGSGLRRLARKFPHGVLSWSPDGRFVATATEGARIHLASLDRGKRRRFGLGWPQQLATGPLEWLGRRALLLSTRLGRNDRELYALSPDSGEVRALTQNAWADYDAAGSPDGTRLAFVTNRGGRARGALYLMDIRGRSVRRISAPGVVASSPAWGPDGRSVAYVRHLNPGSAIRILDLATGRERALVNGEDPAWSPDGTQLAYSLGERDIYVVGVDGRNARRLTQNPYLDRYPAWAPDGRRLAFVTRVDKNDIYLTALRIAVINADGSGLRHLPVFGRNPAWSPDGREIVFDRRGGLWKVGVEGDSLTRLTTAPELVARFEQNPDWLPKP